ncbi:NifU family protein [bacterium]|nr:NifU family protein [bacterium]
MFIQTQSTPNPETLKFLPGRDVSPETPYEFTTPEEATASPLAAELISIDGVERIFFGDEFIAITKQADADWSLIRAHALAAIMDHFVAGAPLLVSHAGEASPTGEADEVYEGETAEIVSEIKELIETRVRPAVAKDGGDIIFQRFDVSSGVVTLVLRGACSGCPSSMMTLKQGVENLLRHYVPEVTAVEAAA